MGGTDTNSLNIAQPAEIQTVYGQLYTHYASLYNETKRINKAHCSSESGLVIPFIKRTFMYSQMWRKQEAYYFHIWKTTPKKTANKKARMSFSQLLTRFGAYAPSSEL